MALRSNSQKMVVKHFENLNRKLKQFTPENWLERSRPNCQGGTAFPASGVGYGGRIPKKSQLAQSLLPLGVIFRLGNQFLFEQFFEVAQSLFRWRSLLNLQGGKFWRHQNRSHRQRWRFMDGFHFLNIHGGTKWRRLRLLFLPLPGRFPQAGMAATSNEIQATQSLRP